MPTNGLPYKVEINPCQTSKEIFGADGTGCAS
jgi:hypothetical protein